MLVLFLFVAVPSIIIYLLGLPNGLISMLIYMQLLIIWIQAELSMRQQFLFRSQFVPILTLRALSTEVTVSARDSKITETKTVTITARNLSDNPAFNIMLSRVLANGFKPLEPIVWANFLRCEVIDHLGSKEEKPLCSTTFAELVKLLKIAELFEVSYSDKYGAWHSAAFMVDVDKKIGNVRIVTIPYLGSIEDIGILLPLFYRITLYFKFKIKIARKFKTEKQASVK